MLGYDVVNVLLFGIENIVLLVVAALAVMDGKFTVGMVFAFVAYQTRFMDSTRGLIERGIEMHMASVHIERLSDIVLARSEPSDDGLAIARSEDSQSNVARADGTDITIVGRVEVRNLGFRYGENERDVFSQLSFSIAAGETVAITGPSGCGKTTLIKCLLGLLQPTSGEILIDGRPMATVRGYRTQVSGIMQEDGLLVGTLADNIAAFATDINYLYVEECARLACIHDDIMRTPMQYNTYVNEMGSGMSAGQQQRIIVARALYRKPRIVFMDEATSHLDVNNELTLSRNIKALAITRILVAHRPETIRSADREIKMELCSL
jgi:ATP-binding cassette subfamily B protein RaxB